jgi:alcohol dehydrogenase class IV
VSRWDERAVSVVHGHGVASGLAAIIEGLAGDRPVMVVHSRAAGIASPPVRQLLRRLEPRVVATVERAAGQGTLSEAIALGESIRRCEVALVVAVGGGAVIDLVKVAALAASSASSGRALEALALRPGVRPPEVRVDVAQIALPTTLSGAEHSDLAASTHDGTGAKLLFRARGMAPAAVVLDPCLALATPTSLWRSTGVRSVDHAIETVCSAASHPRATSLALAGLTQLAAALQDDGRTPSHLARGHAQVGAWLASAGIGQVPFGASHGVGHVLGVVAGVPHGISSCVLLPSVLRFNEEKTANQQALIADALGARGAPAADVVGELISGLGLPRRLRDVGVRREHLPDIASRSLDNVFVAQNPRPIVGADDVREILEAAW